MSQILPKSAADRSIALNGDFAPNWMCLVLKAAGIYNLLWGIFAIVFPTAIFRWAGFDPLPEYPELWQCIGMIVGVYGVGYWIAGTNPYRHWPIVLVGLLGKILGPIGFVAAVLSERFPASMGWTILTNDLIWWVPFVVILFGAARDSQARSTMELSDVIPCDQNGRSFEEVTAQGRHLVVLLRHAGCTFCRESLAKLSADRVDLEARGWHLVIVHMGPEAGETEALFSRYSLENATRISDPGSVLYRRFQLPLGNIADLLGVQIWVAGFRAFVFGRHGIGKLVGNGFQMPGTVLIENGRVLHVEAGPDASYIPDACALSSSVFDRRGEASHT